jgi:hypothetical protein
MIHMRNLPTTDPAVFEGKKRHVHVAVQGKFKRRVRCVHKRWTCLHVGEKQVDYLSRNKRVLAACNQGWFRCL